MKRAVHARGENMLVNRLRGIEADCKKTGVKIEVLHDSLAVLTRLETQCCKPGLERNCFMTTVLELARAFKKHRHLVFAKQSLALAMKILYAVPGDVSTQALEHRRLVADEIAGLAKQANESANHKNSTTETKE
jgi:hypothetical protein